MGKAAIQFDIERRMSEELLPLEREAEAARDHKMLRRVDRLHKKWQARFPEAYEEWFYKRGQAAMARIEAMGGLYGELLPKRPDLRIVPDPS